MVQAEAAVPNARQVEEWNGETGRRWLERHERVDQQIAVFGRRAMVRADIRPGERIIDVGCGCGETTVGLGQRVGGTGFVLGVDVSGVLLGTARHLVEKNGLANVSFEEADAQSYSFATSSFDLVFSRFGIMFFDDPEAAFRNLRAALRPGGRVVFVCWPEPQQNLFVTIPMAAAARHISMPAPGEPKAPGPFAFADMDRVHGMLSRSGFTDIETDRLIEKVGGGTLDQTTQMLLQLGPLGDKLDGLDERTRRAIAADIRTALTPFETSGRVLFDAVAWLVTARVMDRNVGG